MLDLSYFVKSWAISFQTLRLLWLGSDARTHQLPKEMAGGSTAIACFYGLTGRF
jgi:hypothetical protein